jgi:hypothetical protein
MKIKTLDSKEWELAELLDNMHSDEFYYGYLGKNAFSSSSLKLLLDSPKTYKYVTQYGSEESQALRDGKLFHTLVLEPNKLNEYHFVDVQSKNTKAYQEAKKEHKLVFTQKELEDAERLADAIFKNERAKELLMKSEFEIPAAGILYGYPFRAKADILKPGAIVDLKTTTDVRNFQYSAKKYRYALQVYIYCQLFNIEYKDFTFLCIDKGNLDIGIFTCSEDFYYSGEQMLLEALETYKSYFETEGTDVNDYLIKGIL